MTESEAHDCTVFACSLWPWVAKWTPERLRALRDGFKYIDGVGMEQARAALSELCRTTDKTPQPKAMLAAIRGCKPVVATAPAAGKAPKTDHPGGITWPDFLRGVANGTIPHKDADDPRTFVGELVARHRKGHREAIA